MCIKKQQDYLFPQRLRAFTDKEHFKKYVLSNEEKFSPSYFSSKYGINQGIGISICDELLSENPKIIKHYFVECEKCNFEKEIGNSLDQITTIPECEQYDCEKCHNENLRIFSYYENTIPLDHNKYLTFIEKIAIFFKGKQNEHN